MHEVELRSDDAADATAVGPLDRIAAELEQLRADFEATTRLASHDPLTGLPNRRTILERMSEWLSAATPERPVAALFVDVDRFKLINDLYGHDSGDRALIQVAERLHAAAGPGDDVARLGGDEFLVVSRAAGPEQLQQLVARLEHAVHRPVDLGHRSMPLTASVGVATASGPVAAPELVGRADAAMYRAKEQGRGCTVHFDDGMAEEMLERATLERQLSTALQDGQLLVHYQPTFELTSGRIVGVDALVRWEHPELGTIPAQRFVPLAEAVGEVWAIDTFVLAETAARLADWHRLGHHDLRMAVNLSGQLLRDAHVVELLAGLVERHDIPAGAFQLDISESTVMDDRSGTPHGTLRDLADLGVRLGVDNFGTAASSLSTLKDLPVDVVNIDRGFTAGAGTVADDDAILRAILGLARAFGIDAVAEGIESEAQQQWLVDAGFRLGRGYHLSRPVEPGVVTELLGAPAPRA
ncbi:MAG: putative bifunctional diguanylate cyclase/phosphodiesterase [Microthrixaceae bacterium]